MPLGPGAASPAQSHPQCVWCDTHPATVLLAVELPSATVPCRSLPWLTVSLLGYRFAQPLRPPSVRLLRYHGLDGGDYVLQLGHLTKGTASWQPVVLGHSQDECALVRLQAFEESVQLVGHARAVAALKKPGNRSAIDSLYAP